MKLFSFFCSLAILILTGCGGGGGGSTTNVTNNPPANTSKNTVKTGTANAANTAPWKNETAETPNGGQVATAKNNLSSINDKILVSVTSSGKKNKTDTIQDTIKGPIRGSITYKNTYTIDDIIVNDVYSYTNESVVKYLGYEEVGFGLNGESKFSTIFSQTSLNNFTYTDKGQSSISYKDATGVFVFQMSYEDSGAMVDGIETIISKYTIDGESYYSTTVYDLNGDYVYTTTYVENGISYTSTEKTQGNTTTYVISHLENGVEIIDEESSDSFTITTIDGIQTEIYTYTYVENGVTYTSSTTTANGITTYVLSHIENGSTIIDSQSTGTYTVTTLDGFDAEIYTEEYVENGITYTVTTTIVNEITYYLTTHLENGETITDSYSSYYTSIVDGVETEIYSEVFVEDGVTYYYVSSTANDVTTDITSHIDTNGQTVIDVNGTYTYETVNEKLVEKYIEVYIVDGISYESTSTTVDGVTTVVTKWTENGKEYTDTYTY